MNEWSGLKGPMVGKLKGNTYVKNAISVINIYLIIICNEPRFGFILRKPGWEGGYPSCGIKKARAALGRARLTGAPGNKWSPPFQPLHKSTGIVLIDQDVLRRLHSQVYAQLP